jgi:hypothetical protein
MYYGARYYDPGIGRFITADTIVPAKGMAPLTVRKTTFRKSINGNNDYLESVNQLYSKKDDGNQMNYGSNINQKYGARHSNSISSSAFNRYKYVNGNPINSQDIDGHIAPLVIALIAIGVSMIIGGLANAAVMDMATPNGAFTGIDDPNLWTAIGQGALSAGLQTAGFIICGPWCAAAGGAIAGGINAIWSGETNPLVIGANALIGGTFGFLNGTIAGSIPGITNSILPGLFFGGMESVTSGGLLLFFGSDQGNNQSSSQGSNYWGLNISGSQSMKSRINDERYNSREYQSNSTNQKSLLQNEKQFIEIMEF